MPMILQETWVLLAKFISQLHHVLVLLGNQHLIVVHLGKENGLELVHQRDVKLRASVKGIVLFRK
jgi:hypothetical protein